MILRRQDIMNNNAISTSQKRDKTSNNIKMPPIGNKQQKDEQVSDNLIRHFWCYLLTNIVSIIDYSSFIPRESIFRE
jgi:hypothetical protein